MRIEAELDDLHAERLLALQQRLQKPLPEIVRDILAQAIDAKITTCSETAPSRPRRSPLPRFHKAAGDGPVPALSNAEVHAILDEEDGGHARGLAGH